MKLLIDLDGLFYKATYKSISFTEVRDYISDNGIDSARKWFVKEILKRGEERVEAELSEIRDYLDGLMGEGAISGTELFVTTCPKSFRKEISKEYKAKRSKNEWVSVLRSHYILFKEAVDDKTLEADDLISLRAKELGVGNYIVVSSDKDLKQIGGHYWSYYRQKKKDSKGRNMIDEFGSDITEYKQKEMLYIKRADADKMFWSQMLTGDAVDGIAGVKGIGVAKAKKIIDKSQSPFIAVAREYVSRELRDEFKVNYQLLKLK